jgi:hypothetical protein
VSTPARAAWAIAPLLAAGLVHVAVLKGDFLPQLATPLDGGASWRGRALLGPNKTLRGLLLMPAATAAAVRLQAAAEARSPRLAALSISGRGRRPWRVGFWLGLAYVAAELPNSFVKRRLGIPAGGRASRLGGVLQYLADQGDSVLGCLVMLRLLGRPPLAVLAVAGGLGFGVHSAVDVLMRVLGVRR